MNTFSISDLQRFSGIKSHTIRIWEQRYNALQPERSEGNTRYYNGDQLRRLLNIVSLMNAGYKISELGGLPDKDLYRLLSETHNSTDGGTSVHEYFISQIIRAGIEFNEYHLEKLFSACILKYGIQETYLRVIYPVLNRIGLMWAENAVSPAQEHFICNIFRQKLSVAIDSLPPAGDSKDLWLLFLPEDEFHEIGLLFSSYILRQAGKRVVYLGPSTTFDALESAAKILKPTDLLFFLVRNDEPRLADDYVGRLTKAFASSRIHVSGNDKLIAALKKRRNLNWIKSVGELEQKMI